MRTESARDRLGVLFTREHTALVEIRTAQVDPVGPRQELLRADPRERTRRGGVERARHPRSFAPAEDLDRGVAGLVVEQFVAGEVEVISGPEERRGQPSRRQGEIRAPVGEHRALSQLVDDRDDDAALPVGNSDEVRRDPLGA